jgi:hypothetical protein
LLQIGDGDVTVVREARAESPVPGDDRLVGGETTSLCLPTAAADARVCVLVDPLPDTLILTSDGYANSFASPTWRTDAGIDLRHQILRIGLDGVRRLLAWLPTRRRGGDDVSMALVQRADAPAPHPKALSRAARVRSRPQRTPASRACSLGGDALPGAAPVVLAWRRSADPGIAWPPAASTTAAVDVQAPRRRRRPATSTTTPLATRQIAPKLAVGDKPQLLRRGRLG